MRSKKKIQCQSKLEGIIAPTSINICRNWKAQNQILAFAILLFLSILIVVYLLSYQFLLLMIQELQRNSNLIFQSEKNSQIQRFSQLQLQITDNFFLNTLSQLERLNDLFHLTQQGINITQPSDCIFNFNESDSFLRNYQFCYGFCNYTNLTDLVEYENMLNFTSMLTEYAGLLDFSSKIFFVGLTNDQYFSNYESKVKKGFLPHSRPWYLNHMAQMSTGNELIVSTPYFSQSMLIHVAQTYNLTNLNNEFIGIIGKTGDFSDLPKFNTSQITPTIVNYNGDLVLSNLYETEQIVSKFYQSNLTGFNEDDWNSIIKKNSSNHEIFTIELYNSLSDQVLLFTIIDMKNPPFFIILYVNDTDYNQDEKALFAQLYDFQNDNIILYLQIDLVVVIILLTVQFFTIRLISGELQQLTSMTRRSIISRGNQQKYDSQTINKFSNKSIQNLFQAYHSLIRNLTARRSGVRNEDCKQLEFINYPFQYFSIDRQLLFKYFSLMRHQIFKVKNATNSLHNIYQIISSSLNDKYKKESN